MTIEVSETFNSRICKEIRNILSQDNYIISKLTDSKRATDPIIGNSQLNFDFLRRDYMMSVYHTLYTEYETENNILIVRPVAYLDFYRKFNHKNVEQPLDELDKFVETVLGILLSHERTLNGSCHSWELVQKKIFSKEMRQIDRLQEKSLNDLICQVSLLCEIKRDITTLN